MAGTTDCGTLLNQRNEMRGNGEDTSAIDQQLQACSLARGTWAIDANGTQGALVIRTLDTSGNIEGNILGDDFTGRWDTASRTLTFSRVTPSQHYTGTSMPYVDPTTQVSESTLAGLFTEDTLQESFGWFAQTAIVPDSLAPAPTHTYQDGAVVLSSQHSQLSDFDAHSPTTVGAETVTSAAHASPDGTDNAFLWNVEQTSNEVGLHKDLSGSKVRVFRHDIKIDSAATLSNEHTYFHAWTDHFQADLVQIRVAPRDGNGKGDFVFALRAPDSSGHFTLSRYSFDHFQRDQWYTVELYMNDIGFQLKAGPYDQPPSTIIDWYGVSDQFSNQGKFMGVIALSKFFSANFKGKYYVHAPEWLADYIYPAFPSSLEQQISAAWLGWKNRYLRSDGLVRRPNPQGVDGGFQQASDNVSEATAYGLLLAVQMNDPMTFDRIYGYDAAHLQRSQANTTSDANKDAQNRDVKTAFHLSGWHYDDEHNKMYDFNFATDAEIDKALALVWAARRKAQGHTEWATSSIDYATEATQVISDLKNFCFRTVNGKAYQVTDSFQGNANPVEINPSYLSVAAYTIYQNFTNDPFWASALSGAYDILTKDTHATMNDRERSNKAVTGVGYWSEWCGLDPATGNAVTPPHNREIHYGFNAFRVPYRVYWDLIWNNSASAKTLLTGNIRQDFINMWNTPSTGSPKAIFAELWYDGTVKGPYEKSMMTMAAYFTLLVASSSDPTAAEIWSAKLAHLFTQNPGGEYFMDGPNTSGQFVGQPSYFSDSWMMIGMLLKNGTWQNF